VIKFELFSDQDGVLANFMGKLQEHYPDSYDGMPDNILWPRVESIPNFWESLEWMPDGRQLWEHIIKLDPNAKVLTAPSKDPRCIPGKRKWIAENLGSHVEVLMCRAIEKKNYAAPNRILIDDVKKNIDGWVGNGGIGIHHTSTIETIVLLEGHFQSGGR
jgi:5'(3')-deoxyribonucleotidase